MQGTILIIDGVSTNRIMLKVQLSAAWYHVVQADRLEGCDALIRRTRPNLIVTAMTLPDGTAIDLRRRLAKDRALADIPMIAITAENDRTARIHALEAGVDDVLSQPLDDFMLQARIRGLLRGRAATDALHLHDIDHGNVFGPPPHNNLAEPIAPFAPALPKSRVVLLTQCPTTAPVWRRALSQHLSHDLQCFPVRDVHTLMSQQAPDAVVLELPNPTDSFGLRLIADLRARSATSDVVIIAVPNPACIPLAAEALDRGAHDVLSQGFCAQELSLRLNAQLRRRAFAQQLRNSVRDGLRDAMRDPMTGLHNRRYALPEIKRLAHSAAQTRQKMALLMVDLDHFKQVNDRHGHLAGDAVLVEAARRMRAVLRPCDLISRVGGEEFLIALPDVDRAAAYETAVTLCQTIDDTPFKIPGASASIHVTTSIGLAVGPDASATCQEDIVANLMHQADQALYAAKDGGRNQASLARHAA